MTRAQSRIAVRMLGCLIIGLAIPPAVSCLAAIPWVCRHYFVLETRQIPWIASFVIRAIMFPLFVLFGIFLIRRAHRVSRIIFPEAAP